MRASTGLWILAALTLLAICGSWLMAGRSIVSYWLAAQAVPVLYAVIAWRSSRSADDQEASARDEQR